MRVGWTLLMFVCAIAAVSAGACGGGSGPAAPSPAPPAGTAPSLQAPLPKSPLGGQQLDTLKPTLSVTNAVTAGAVGTVTYEFEVSEADTFPAGSRTKFARGVAQAADGTTTWAPPDELIPSLTYFWRARATATNVAAPSAWSRTETFKTRIGGVIIPGQELHDPLTGGSTIGTRIGGHFVAGQGWQADSDGDGLFYDFGACTSCTLEFDVTNFGRAAGASRNKDVKWITMGDASTFGDFNAFRDHPWKMHLEQRSDGDGTGMKLIWRNGDAGGGNPGDHELRNDMTVDWQSNTVYHFTLRWTPAGFEVQVGIVGADGQVTGNRVWFSGSFGGRAFAPPLLRVALGCYPRNETMAGAIWRNVRLVRN